MHRHAELVVAGRAAPQVFGDPAKSKKLDERRSARPACL